jgi:hypothetical protein
MPRPGGFALPERTDRPTPRRGKGGQERTSPPAPLPQGEGSRAVRWSLALELGALALGLWGAAHILLLTVYGRYIRNGDVLEYQRYTIQFWTQPPLFHHLPVEYPPLAIVPFTLTAIPPLRDPVVVFAWWMAALVVAGYLWLRRYVSRGRAIVFAAYLLLGASATVLGRYDLFPALATLLALWAAQRRRFNLAYALLAVGILLKLYPVFLVPLVAVEQWRALRVAVVAPGQGAAGARRNGNGRGGRRWRRESTLRQRARNGWQALVRAARRPETAQVARGLGLCAGIVALVFAGAALLNPAGAFSGFSYAGSRPLQIESTPASLLWLGTLFGAPAHAVYTYHSLNYVGPLDRALAPLALVALAGGCVLVYWRLLRGRLDLGRAFVACLCVVLVANKIFSPQYLIWILPLVAYVAGFDVLWLAIGLLTTFIYPFVYFAHPHILLVARDPWFLPALALRNGLLLVVAVRAIRGDPAVAAAGLTTRLWHTGGERAVARARPSNAG